MKHIAVFFIIITFSNNVFSLNIVVVEVDELISKNNEYINIINEIEKRQEIYFEKLKIEEGKIDALFKEIEASKLILSESELNNLKINYNNALANFKILVDNFNTHYQNEVANIKKILLDQIIILIENYANDNQVDIVLDSTSYLIASNSINITDEINILLDKIKLNLEFKNFENN